MMLEPHQIDWSEADDSTVYHAAVDGIPEAVEEQRRRELARRTAPNQDQSE